MTIAKANHLVQHLLFCYDVCFNSSTDSDRPGYFLLLPFGLVLGITIPLFSLPGMLKTSGLVDGLGAGYLGLFLSPLLNGLNYEYQIEGNCN